MFAGFKPTMRPPGRDQLHTANHVIDTYFRTLNCIPPKYPTLKDVASKYLPGSTPGPWFTRTTACSPSALCCMT